MFEMFNEDGELSREWIAQVVDPPSFGGRDINELDEPGRHTFQDLEAAGFRDPDFELTDVLQEGTIRLIQKRINRDSMPQELSPPDLHYMKHRLATIKVKIQGRHPPEGSAITGPVRAFLLDDSMADLEPLDQKQRDALDIVFTSLACRITRSRHGFKRKEINTDIVRQEAE